MSEVLIKMHGDFHLWRAGEALFVCVADHAAGVGETPEIAIANLEPFQGWHCFEELVRCVLLYAIEWGVNVDGGNMPEEYTHIRDRTKTGLEMVRKMMATATQSYPAPWSGKPPGATEH